MEYRAVSWGNVLDAERALTCREFRVLLPRNEHKRHDGWDIVEFCLLFLYTGCGKI